jgi:hypothetical protein
MGEQQLSLQAIGEQLIRLIVVIARFALVFTPFVECRSLQQALPFLTPVIFVVSIIVIARARNRNFLEFRVAQNRRGRCEAAAGVTPDTYPIKIHPFPCLRELPNARHLVRQAVIAHIAVVGIVERLRATRRAHCV